MLLQSAIKMKSALKVCIDRLHSSIEYLHVIITSENFIYIIHVLE